MKKSQWSNYAKYLMLADSSEVLRGTYNGYVNYREVCEILKTLVTKRTTSYLYNGEVVTFDLTQTQLGVIFDTINDTEYVLGFDHIRHIANRLKIKTI